MNKEEIYKYIDHTLLRPTSRYDEIKTLCEEAIKYNTASVCIPPCFIKRVRKDFPELNICTVIGFPLGYNASEVKVFETETAIKDGANEIDMVINQGDVKAGDFVKVKEEIEAVKKACNGKILKVIIETCNLTEGEKIAMCQVVTEAGADFIKTSTGFGEAGATRADIEIFKDMIGPNVKMKAAGGVKTREDLEDFIELGCARIGTSSALKLLNEDA
ncbi:MAG: deoxyribose-phosphate aldolase [Lachnospiraceae bacterium]|nr:deoxyribose-phosphate aldolase [Lachnospiraceae bacterium]